MLPAKLYLPPGTMQLHFAVQRYDAWWVLHLLHGRNPTSTAPMSIQFFYSYLSPGSSNRIKLDAITQPMATSRNIALIIMAISFVFWLHCISQPCENSHLHFCYFPLYVINVLSDLRFNLQRQYLAFIRHVLYAVSNYN